MEKKLKILWICGLKADIIVGIMKEIISPNLQRYRKTTREALGRRQKAHDQDTADGSCLY